MAQTGLRTNVYKNWTEFLGSDLPVLEKQEILKRSSLLSTNPSHQRASVWLGLVDPGFSQSAQAFLRDYSDSEDPYDIKEEVAKSYLGPLQALSSPERLSKLQYILNAFVCKRPDIGYHSGMNHIGAVLLTVFISEIDAFVVFCHIIETVFPSGFFVDGLVMHSELRAFSLMAHKLRPKIANTLTSVFKENLQKVHDDYPFTVTMKRFSFYWLSSLYANCLLPNDILRVWDAAFIFGMDFIHKFGLTLLCKFERFLKNTIKQTTRALNIDSSPEVLEVAANLTKARLMRKIERLPVEKMIRKAIFKHNYRALVRATILERAVQIEEDPQIRLKQLKRSKNMLKAAELELEEKNTQDVIKALSKLETEGSITRAIFQNLMTRYFNWTNRIVTNIFVTFDQYGNDYLNFQHIQIGLILIGSFPVHKKLGLIYSCFDVNETQDLSVDSCLKIFENIEKTIDFRTSYAKKAGESFKELFEVEEVNSELFVRIFTESFVCKPIVDYMNSIESDDLDQVDLLKIPEYEYTHSPMQATADASPMSDLDYEGPNPEELEDRLGELARIRNENNSDEERTSFTEKNDEDLHANEAREEDSNAQNSEIEDLGSQTEELESKQIEIEASNEHISLKHEASDNESEKEETGKVKDKIELFESFKSKELPIEEPNSAGNDEKTSQKKESEDVCSEQLSDGLPENNQFKLNNDEAINQALDVSAEEAKKVYDLEESPEIMQAPISLPGEVTEFKNDDVNLTNLVEFPDSKNQRNTCSRLCSKETCSMF